MTVKHLYFLDKDFSQAIEHASSIGKLYNIGPYVYNLLLTIICIKLRNFEQYFLGL